MYLVVACRLHTLSTSGKVEHLPYVRLLLGVYTNLHTTDGNLPDDLNDFAIDVIDASVTVRGTIFSLGYDLHALKYTQ